MTQRDFAPIADSLRRAVISFYQEPGALDGPAGINTLETNSGYVERRGAPCWISWGAAAGVSRSTVCKWPISAVASEPSPSISRHAGQRSSGSTRSAPGWRSGASPRASRAQGRVRDRADGGSGARRCELRSRGPKQQPVLHRVREDRDRALRETHRVQPRRISDREESEPLASARSVHRTAAASAAASPPGHASQSESASGARRFGWYPPEGGQSCARPVLPTPHEPSSASRWPGFAKPFARYQHLVARRPG